MNAFFRRFQLIWYPRQGYVNLTIYAGRVWTFGIRRWRPYIATVW